MRRALPVMTDAFTGMATYLESQTKEERDELKTVLREYPYHPHITVHLSDKTDIFINCW
ncbi:MAG: hypothetical protein GX640_10185 [Fibrobacter sp.]|nr:hypothetical protein [Fibrobacter sp.]